MDKAADKRSVGYDEMRVSDVDMVRDEWRAVGTKISEIVCGLATVELGQCSKMGAGMELGMHMISGDEDRMVVLWGGD